MSAYPPPKENLPIYNPTDFEYENFPLTIQDAKDFFLEYPTAQGAETLASIVVNGASTFNDVATINDSLDIIQPTSTLNALNIENDNVGVSITATSKTNKGTAGALTINGSSTANKENPIVEDGDSVVSSSIQGANDTGGLTLTQKSITGSGIRIADNKVNIFPGIVFPDGTEQTTASSSAPSMNFPTSWVSSNGNQFITPNLVGTGETATIQLPYAVSTPPVNPPVASNAITLSLEIRYTITFATNEYFDLASYEYPEMVFNGYWRGLIFIQPTSVVNTSLTPQPQVIETITDYGNMFNSQTIASTGNVSKTGFTPITIDYNNQTDFNKLEITFGDCEPAITPPNNVGLTSFTRSITILDNYAVNNTLGSNTISRMTLPNSNVANVPVGAYFTPY